MWILHIFMGTEYCFGKNSKIQMLNLAISGILWFVPDILPKQLCEKLLDQVLHKFPEHCKNYEADNFLPEITSKYCCSMLRCKKD